ncbi:g4350 [Coccomyxa elongata]
MYKSQDNNESCTNHTVIAEAPSTTLALRMELPWMYWLIVIGTIVVGGASWYLYREPATDGVCKQKVGIANPAFGRGIVFLAQYATPFITAACTLDHANKVLPAWVSLRAFTPGTLELWASALFGLAAFGLFVAAKQALSTNYSPLYNSKIPDGVVKTGPYSCIRHPIYTANLALLTAATGMSGSMWNCWILVLLWITYTEAARLEESALCKTFPSYADYMGHTGKFLPQPPIWMYTGIIRLITILGGATLTPRQLVCDADLAKFQANFEARSDAKVTLKYLRKAIVMGYITKDGQMAAGYVVNATLPLRYFTFLPKQERFPAPHEPSEQDFVEITCIWIDKHLTSYVDRGVVYLESVETARNRSDKPFLLGGSNVPRVHEQQMHAFTTPLRSFVSVVHKPPCPYWIYYGSADATLIRTCKTMLNVIFSDIAAICGLQTNNKAFSYKRKYKKVCKNVKGDAIREE